MDFNLPLKIMLLPDGMGSHTGNTSIQVVVLPDQIINSNDICDDLN